MGENKTGMPSFQAILTHDYRRKEDKKVHFLAGSLCNNEAKILFGQGSHMLKSLSEANILIKLREDEINLKKGDSVNVYYIP